jgi:hypothetical protein
MTAIVKISSDRAAYRVVNGQEEMIRGSFTIRLLTIRGRSYSIMYKTWDYGRG